MRYNADIHQRHSIRIREYDYSQVGAYFVTVCTYNREFIFGEITEGEMRLNDIGQVVVDEWLRTGDVRKNVELDVFVVMPNHFHGIIVITDISNMISHVGANRRLALTTMGMPTAPKSNSIGAIICQFKSIVTKRINAIRGIPGMPVWQRNYYEHIIRTEDELNRLREYIVNNPAQWAFDNENPDCDEKNIPACGGPSVFCRGEPTVRPSIG